MNYHRERFRKLTFRALAQPRSQGLFSLPPLVFGTETLVAAGHVTNQNLGRGKICWKGGATGFFSRPNVLEYPPTLRFWMDRWSRDQPQAGSLFQRLREAEKRDPGNEVGVSPLSERTQQITQTTCLFSYFKASKSIQIVFVMQGFSTARAKRLLHLLECGHSTISNLDCQEDDFCCRHYLLRSSLKAASSSALLEIA